MAKSDKTTASQHVLLTGASGFIGAAIVRELLNRGHSVSVVLRNPERAARIAAILDKTKIHQGDLSDPGFIEKTFSENEIDAVIHCAWQGATGANRNDLTQTNNIVAARALMEGAAQHGCRRFIGVGSQAEYGPLNKRISESDTTRPTTEYGKAKCAAHEALAAYANENNIRFTWVRIFSVYGPRDHETCLIPYLIKALRAGKSPDLTPGEQLWDYLYVEDAARAFAALVEHPDASGIYNLGSGQALPLRDIIMLLKNSINPSIELGFGRVAYRPDQVMHLEADITKISRATGWKPEMPLQEGLQRTIAACQEHT